MNNEDQKKVTKLVLEILADREKRDIITPADLCLLIYVCCRPLNTERRSLLRGGGGDVRGHPCNKSCMLHVDLGQKNVIL